MKRWPVNRVLKWWPSFLRGGLWVGIQTLTAYMGALQVLTDEQYASMSTRTWLILHGSVLLAGLAAWRTYIDSSHQTQKQKVANEESFAAHPSYVAGGHEQPVP